MLSENSNILPNQDIIHNTNKFSAKLISPRKRKLVQFVRRIIDKQ